MYAPELRLVVWDDERVVWDTHGIAALLPASLAQAIRWCWTLPTPLRHGGSLSPMLPPIPPQRAGWPY